jgi:hypothetical protein
MVDVTHTAFPDALASDVQEAIGALVDRENVTVKRALSVVERAASEIEANLTLLGIEAKRQADVSKARAERERARAAEAERSERERTDRERRLAEARDARRSRALNRKAGEKK